MIYEKRVQESVKTVRKWVIQETEFETVAAETIHGLQDQGSKYHRKEMSNLSNWKTGSNPFRQCIACGKRHLLERTLKGVVKKLKSVNVNERWKGAKQHQLCYLYLGLGHFGQTVPFISPCDADVKLCWKIADMT